MSSLLHTIPENLERRACILYFNGFGFQPPNQGLKDAFGLCLVGDLTNQQINNIRTISGASTIKYGDWIDHTYLSIHWTEYNKHVAVLNTLLTLGQKNL